jgi:dethiobiotin synthetase
VSALFITATGTDCGKTFVTSGLLRHLRALGPPARALKPVVSGFDEAAPAGSDPAELLAAMGEPVTAQSLAQIAPLRFKAPLAATMAARLEGRSLTLADILRACEAAMADPRGLLLIEGAGGVMSPFAEGATCLDAIKALGLPCLLVTGTYLGAISHTLTALAAMRAAGCSPIAIAVNESLGSSVSLAETMVELAAFAPDATVTPISRNERDFAALARACGLAT